MYLVFFRDFHSREASCCKPAQTRPTVSYTSLRSQTNSSNLDIVNTNFILKHKHTHTRIAGMALAQGHHKQENLDKFSNKSNKICQETTHHNGRKLYGFRGLFVSYNKTISSSSSSAMQSITFVRRMYSAMCLTVCLGGGLPVCCRSCYFIMFSLS